MCYGEKPRTLDKLFGTLGRKMDELSETIYVNTHYGGDSGRGRRRRERDVGF